MSSDIDESVNEETKQIIEDYKIFAALMNFLNKSYEVNSSSILKRLKWAFLTDKNTKALYNLLDTELEKGCVGCSYLIASGKHATKEHISRMVSALDLRLKQSYQENGKFFNCVVDIFGDIDAAEKFCAERMK